jgi:hypothetical protein
MMIVTAIGVAIVAMTTTTRATGTIETTTTGATPIGAIGTKRLMVAAGAMVWVAPASSNMGVFTHVSAYRNWIDRIIAADRN